MRSAVSIRRRRAAIERQQAETAAKLARLQIECQHATPHYRYRGDSGNCWIEWHCIDCGKGWTTAQDSDEVRRYPGAVNRTA
jgi:hypothetical protein